MPDKTTIQNTQPDPEDLVDLHTSEPQLEGKPHQFDFSIRRPGKRIDRYLSMRFATHSRTVIQKLIRQGTVTVNGKTVKPSYEVRTGDIIHAEFPPIEITYNKPEDIPIRIVYEDDEILAINKQPDIVTHPAPGHSGGTLLNAILHHCGPIEESDTLRPGIVHRLDKDTTGIMLFAKTGSARSNLQQQFESRKIEKTYTALVEKDTEFDADLIDMPIGNDKHNREKMVIDLENGKHAKTVYEVIERFGDYTLVRCMPRTGRTHQIRLHMSAIGHPVASDDFYGATAPVYPSTLDRSICHFEEEEPLLERQALHATTIAFRHPGTKQWMVLEAEHYDDFNATLDFLRKRGPVASQRTMHRIRQRRARKR